MEAGDVGVFEVADVVVADEVEARALFAVQEGVSFKVESRVPDGGALPRSQLWK